MNESPKPSNISLSISAVERDTGISKDTLRVWERRYGFPGPERDQYGERLYSLEQVDKLRLIRRLLDLGHRPGRIVRHTAHDLQALVDQTTPAPIVERDEALEVGLDHFLELLKNNNIEELRAQLAQTAMRLGVEKFVTCVAAPLTQMIGDAWARGYLQIFEEHLYTESIEVVIRNAINSIPQQQPGSPRVLLTTFPNEPHGIGLLMVEAVMTLEGCRCVSLGTQTPILEIIAASAAQKAEIVALSFTAAPNPTLIYEGIDQLRANLPESVELWIGGRCPSLSRRSPAAVHLLDSLTDIRPRLARWRGSRIS